VDKQWTSPRETLTNVPSQLVVKDYTRLGTNASEIFQILSRIGVTPKVCSSACLLARRFN
jgi:hypothetical protein